MDEPTKTASTAGTAELTPTDQIEVMLHEYDTLRTEILNRINNRFTVVSIFFAIVGFSIATTHLVNVLIIVPAGTAALYFIWRTIGAWIEHCSRHIASLERRINTEAGQTLLSWETRMRSESTHLPMLPVTPPQVPMG
jgi:hypothetical protein